MEVLRTAGLVVRYGKKAALAGVDIAVDGPGVVGVLGPNGAGKTTLFDVLQGALTPSEGEAFVFGRPITRATYPRRRVGVVLQREFVMEGMSVGEYAELFAAIHGVGDGLARVLHRAALAGRERVPVDRLSGGEAQRLFIAAATVHEPELVFLDEPTSQLDPQSKLAIGAELRELGRARTVVMTTHDMREAERVCDRVVFVTEGLVRADGTPEELVRGVPGAGTLEDAFVFHAKTRIGDRGDAL